MSRKSLLPRSLAKNGFKGVKVITFIGVASLMFTQVIVASELKTVTKVPTTYNVSELSYLVDRQIPAGYVKANYKAIYSPSTQSKTPSSKDLSLQEAAEIAAQEIFKFSGEKLDNQTLQMLYFHSSQALRPYSYWQVSVNITPSYHFHVEIDGSTGKLIRILYIGGPNIDNEFDVDAPSTTKLSKEGLDTGSKQFNPDLAKVQNLITKSGYIAEPIKSIKYQYMSADAYAVFSHTFYVTTASNKIHSFSLSQDLTQLKDYYPLGIYGK
ncbi:hypothetical protein [Paenibacillus glacialis]|uniref:Uncharacterized protein n=1 Tax=Paenibacillus glacialis TaxID=494026 RepID=A0A168KGU7_9BACL|nr:hypothetical protein [Paenibacillus glacialis]OAB41987.1 hypothetical protein PGLA_14280 [Paenibacillus glacialis]